MPEIEINGKSIYYTDEGEGQVLLMGHSYLWDRHMWDAQVKVLSANFRCIVPDLWGHGRSDLLPEGDYSLSDLADDYLLFLDKLGIENFSLIGLSVGGMWSSEIVLKRPASVKQIILMDTYVGEEPEKTKALYFSMLDRVESAGAIPDQMIEELVPLFLSPATIENKAHIADQFRAGLKAFTPEQITTVVKVGRAIFGRRDLLHELENFSLPVLVMTGEDDRPRPVSEAKKMAQLIPGASLIIIPAAGHIPAIEQPEAANEAILNFMGKEESAGNG